MEGVRRARNRALDLAREAPPSASTALALASVSRSVSLIDGNVDEGLALAREALALAEETGDDAAAAICLNTIGMARVLRGDPDGIEFIEQSVERAARAGSVFQLHSSLNNLANMLWHVGRLAEGSERIHEARALCERYGFASALNWNDAELVYDSFFRGDLERAVVGSRAPSSSATPVWPGINDGRYWQPRASALLWQGRLEEALADAEKAVAGRREAGRDAQTDGIVLLTGAQCARAAGRDSEADELLAEVLVGHYDEIVFDLPLHLLELGRAAEFLALTEGQPGHLWLEAGRAAASGELVRASEIYGRIGARFPEAWAALLAAERGDTSRLDAALAYFEEQRATPYVQRCRALHAGLCVGSSHARGALFHGGRSGQPPARGRSVRAARRASRSTSRSPCSRRFSARCG